MTVGIPLAAFSGFSRTGGLFRMMVNCPRCGFSQPNDQYCARCGVDMVTYRPSQKPFLRRLFSSTPFQLCVLAVVVVAVFSIARQQRRKEIADRIAEIENAQNTQVISRRAPDTKSELSSTSPATAPSQKAEAVPAPASAPGSAALQQQGVAPQGTQAQADAAGSQAPASVGSANLAADESVAKSSTGGGRAAAAGTQNLKVTFAWISMSALNGLLSSLDIRNPSSFGPISSGVLPQIATKLKSIQAGDFGELDTKISQIKVGQTTDIYAGQPDETMGQFLGFRVEIQPMQMDENEAQVHIWIRHSLKEGQQIQDVAVAMPETFVIPKGGAAFVSGALGKHGASAEERRFYDPIKVLHIIATEPYRRRLTDLLILIEPK